MRYPVLAIYPFGKMTIRRFVPSSKVVDSSIRRFDTILFVRFYSIYIYIYFFSILVINSFIFHHSAFFFHGLVWLTTNGSRDFRKKFGDPPSGTLFSLRHSWRKKKKKEKREKMDELRSFFSVSIVRISTFVTRVCFSARMYNDSILRKQRENPGNGRERTKKKKIRKREVNDETRRH